MDAVVSLCRVHDDDLPVGVEQIDVRLIDDVGPDANANLDFVLIDTVRLIEQLRGEGRTVLVHCVAARAAHRPWQHSTAHTCRASAAKRRAAGSDLALPGRLPQQRLPPSPAATDTGARLITSLADVSVTKALLTRRVEKPSFQTGGIWLPATYPTGPRLPMVFCTRPKGHEPELRIETQMTTMATPLRRFLPAALFTAAVGLGGSALTYPAIASGEVATPGGETMTATQNAQLSHAVVI